ncbi:MAG: diphosphomevalonate decarboxylase [Candidatus Micrarchaeota archaeon]
MESTETTATMTTITTATATANANIALIKYWGKRDEKLILPTNSSLSFTMDEQLSTKTTVEFSNEFNNDEFYLNGQKATDKETARIIEFLDLIRARAKTSLKAKVISQNTFPKSAGLASSASAFAALAGAASKAAGIELSTRELSIIARRGSGSAIRSIYGGAVKWEMGKKKDGSDSIAVQLVNKEHWPEIRNVIGIMTKEEKKVSSRAGMAETIKTSSLYKVRLKSVRKRLKIAETAILKKDFHALAEIIMRESNNMHAVMFDSWPPIMYLNNASKGIIESTINFNLEKGKNAIAYTFDAGPNPHLYTTVEYVNDAKALLKENGISEIIVCKVGDGLQFSKNHLKV